MLQTENKSQKIIINDILHLKNLIIFYIHNIFFHDIILWELNIFLRFLTLMSQNVLRASLFVILNGDSHLSPVI